MIKIAERKGLANSRGMFHNCVRFWRKGKDVLQIKFLLISISVLMLIIFIIPVYSDLV